MEDVSDQSGIPPSQPRQRKGHWNAPVPARTRARWWTCRVVGDEGEEARTKLPVDQPLQLHQDFLREAGNTNFSFQCQDEHRYQQKIAVPSTAEIRSNLNTAAVSACWQIRYALFTQFSEFEVNDGARRRVDWA